MELIDLHYVALKSIRKAIEDLKISRDDMINIFLVDAHKIVRHAIKMIIADKEDLQIVGEADNALSLQSQIVATQADLLILDINMPQVDGFDLLKNLRSAYHKLNILVFSMYQNEILIRHIMESGARGYLLKSTETEEVLHAIRTVGSGKFYICMAVAERLLARVPLKGLKQQHLSDQPGTNLSKRELQVLNLIADGLTNSEIAEKLFTSKRTIDTHRQNLIEKTRTRNTATLIKYAISNGLLE